MITKKKTSAKGQHPPTKGRRTIAPNFPLSQYGDHSRSAYNAYAQRVTPTNAVTFEEWRSLWDEEQGVAPTPQAPKALAYSRTIMAGEEEARLPVHMMAFRDPSETYSLDPDANLTSSNSKRFRPQRGFGIFPETDKVLRQMATQEKLDADTEGARKNDWLEAAFLLMLEGCRTDEELFLRWREKARRLRYLSRQVQWRGIEQEP